MQETGKAGPFKLQLCFANAARHDFFYFTFEFAGDPPSRVAYFIPQCAVPDRFYTSRERHNDFTIRAFQPYRITLDENMEWVHRIEEIIAANPEPYVDRLHLPPRPVLPPDVKDSDPGRSVPIKKRDRLEDGGDPDQPPRKKPRTKQTTTETTTETKSTSQIRSGIKEQKETVQHAHRRFFYSIIADCATIGRGLLLELARDGIDGDFGYCDYRWTRSEQLAFHNLSRLPATVHTLPAGLPVVFIHYYCKYLESGFTGPKITDWSFRRLDSSTRPRILITDISGPDTTHTGDVNDRPALAIVPSEDLQPTLAHRALMQSNRKAKQSSQYQWEKHTPAVSHFLNQGKFISQYCLPNMPLSGGCDWRAIRDLLNTVVSSQQFQHPVGVTRESAPYRQTLQQYNQQLADYWAAILEGSEDNQAVMLEGIEDNQDDMDKSEE